ncbi:MAG: DEAD/DEAH box helicase [Erysipelothrix sp.]|nr:DEAD/DEAH box helicase [Erysipelothrix sp.]
MNFLDLNITQRIIDALIANGYTEPTEIQQKAIPIILDRKDLLASAQTGTGKTAAFAIPMLQLLTQKKKPKGQRKVRGLIISPTRELAQQIYESYITYGKFLNLKVGVIYGGVSQKRQEKFLRSGVDIIISTPGRLMDLMEQGLVDVSNVEMLVLDEADRLLDMGFIHDIKVIVKPIKTERQTLLFSATLPKSVLDIAKELMDNPVRIAAAKVSSPVEAIEQSLYYVDPDNKKRLLVDLIKTELNDTILVFARTKNNTEQIVTYLEKNDITARAIHGDKSQNKRIKVLRDFKNYQFQVLVATDVASRGIDIDSLACVINYNIPEEAETYIHRIGRTARAGLEGRAIAFCDYGERGLLKDIEKLMELQIPVIEEHEYPMIDETVTPPRSGGGGKRRSSNKKNTGKRNNRSRRAGGGRGGKRKR